MFNFRLFYKKLSVILKHIQPSRNFKSQTDLSRTALHSVPKKEIDQLNDSINELSTMVQTMTKDESAKKYFDKKQAK
jgi:hypothetical protein